MIDDEAKAVDGYSMGPAEREEGGREEKRGEERREGRMRE
jgi:hypothetical protein